MNALRDLIASWLIRAGLALSSKHMRISLVSGNFTGEQIRELFDQLNARIRDSYRLDVR